MLQEVEPVLEQAVYISSKGLHTCTHMQTPTHAHTHTMGGAVACCVWAQVKISGLMISDEGGVDASSPRALGAFKVGAHLMPFPSSSTPLAHKLISPPVDIAYAPHRTVQASLGTQAHLTDAKGQGVWSMGMGLAAWQRGRAVHMHMLMMLMPLVSTSAPAYLSCGLTLEAPVCVRMLCIIGNVSNYTWTRRP